MANKLPWTTPKVQTLYTTSSVGRLIAEYLDAGGRSEAITECRRNTGRCWINRDNGKRERREFSRRLFVFS